MVGTLHSQPGAGVRFDWGLAGAAELGRVCDALVVVDVLSFTTSVEVAVGRGTRVHPFPWEDQSAAYARRVGASTAVAVGRQEVSPERPWSLSPAALLRAPVAVDLVLPSPNGSTICATASATGRPVIAACVRNATAVGRWLLDRGYGETGTPVGVIAAGERWPDGTLRPCVEDQLGAAVVLDVLAAVPGGLSVEAAVALAAFASVPDLPAAIRGCVSGRELVGRGFAEDVEMAVEVGVSDVVPLLRDGVFTPA